MIPPGLIDSNCEIFVSDGELYALVGGSKVPFKALPDGFRQALENDMILHNATGFAEQKCGSDIHELVLEQYAKCNFGNFNNQADFTSKGMILTHEYFECGERGTCKFEGKLCKHIRVANGFLSPREVIYLKLVAVGKLGKEIAELMHISEATVPSYHDKVQQKTGLHTKTEMTGLAYKLGLV